METYKLSRAAAAAVARYLSTYHASRDDESAVAGALYALLNGDCESLVLVDDDPEEG